MKAGCTVRRRTAPPRTAPDRHQRGAGAFTGPVLRAGGARGGLLSGTAFNAGLHTVSAVGDVTLVDGQTLSERGRTTEAGADQEAGTAETEEAEQVTREQEGEPSKKEEEMKGDGQEMRKEGQGCWERRRKEEEGRSKNRRDKRLPAPTLDQHRTACRRLKTPPTPD